MKIAVCVKQALDEAELRVDPSGRPQLEGAATKMSTFDKNAVEEALRVRAALGGEVVVFTVGGPDAKKSLKEALAMGADRGTLVVSQPFALDTLGTARLLSDAIARAGPFDLVVCSEGSSDAYTGQVPPMLAELLGLPYVGYSRKIEAGEGKVVAERALEEAVETVEAPMPAVVSVVSEINEPRYPTLIQIMQAAKKPIEESSPAMPAAERAAQVTGMRVQQVSRKHVIFEGAPEEAAKKLLEALRKDGVLQ
ncbi:MAG: electron transfer flavoprotein subunit beta/FixA family protein [archaeon]|nr:MAG: electron transfer flavoprotein subunit beta/FixA family protein [archaeon]